MRAPTRAAVAVLGLGIGGCFGEPDEPVLFSCDPQSAPACPSGYTCHVDGCCHRDGTDFDAHFSACGSMPSAPTSSATSQTGDPTDGSGSDVGPSTSTFADTDTGTSTFADTDAGTSTLADTDAGTSTSADTDTGNSTATDAGTTTSTGTGATETWSTTT